MAQFRGTILGQRGQASRLGSKVSGLTVTADGWDAGVAIYASVDSDGRDVFWVVSTGGSNDSARRCALAEIVDGEVRLDPWGDVAREQSAEVAS